MKKESPFRICVISFPMPSALVVNVFLYSLVEILEPLCEKVYVVSSNIPKNRTFSEKIRIQDVKTAMHFRNTIQPMWWSTVLQFFKIIIIQMKMCWIMVKISRKFELAIFLGGAYIFPPMIAAKILRKKTIVTAWGLGSLSYSKSSADKSNIISIILDMFEKINFFLTNIIITESKSITEFLNLQRYKRKIIPIGWFVNTKLFRIERDSKDRDNLIGYIGRLSIEKGVMNLFNAMQSILTVHNNVEFLIGGNGPLCNSIKRRVSINLHQKIRLTGWISHDDKLPKYLNNLKLLVLPSYSEGLPTIILEAMACGTPVLATPVGGIPDVIKDGESGFIIENNLPECIAENVIRALEHPNLEEIVKNARKLIEDEYSYEVMVRKCKDSLDELMKSK